jgi:16S rRNA (guanine527-N7)-methyltransferase
LNAAAAQRPPAASLALAPATAQLPTACWPYLDLLQRWNATYNLTAVRDPQAMVCSTWPIAWRCCNAACTGCQQGAFWTWAVVEDCPAWSGHHAAGLDITCVDAVGKKAAFIRQVSAQLKLPNLHAAHARVQDIRLPPFDLITSRAFASLVDFTAWTEKHLGAGGVWMAMKGKIPTDESAVLPQEIEMFHVEPLRVPGLEADRCLVWMRKRTAA